MTRVDVIVIDYGMGNIHSVINALKFLGFNPQVTDDAKVISKSKSLILPGVGSFKKAKESINKLDIDQAITDALGNDDSKILGICLGMQLFGSRSSEDGETNGLNLIPNEVDIFSADEVGLRKIPHIGFDIVTPPADSKLFAGFSEAADFYFVHSYRMMPSELNGTSAVCDYGVKFLAAFEHKNIFGTQFHPEKSQTNGLKLLHNFMAL